MKKNYMFVTVAMLFIISSCAKTLIPPYAGQIKKMAIVSIYMNSELHDIKTAPAGKKGSGLKIPLKAMLPSAAEKKQLIDAALEHYSAALDTVGSWSIMPPAELVSSEEYGRFMTPADKGAPGKIFKFLKSAEDRGWTAPENMRVITINSITGAAGTKSTVDKESMRKMLAELCRAIGVDAAAVIELDLGYSSGISFGSGLPVNKTGIKPSISHSMIAVTKDGDIAVKTPKGGKRYKGDSVMLTMIKGAPVLNEKAVAAFSSALENSSEGLRDGIAKAFAKLK